MADLFNIGFLTVRLVDLIDISIVAFLLYKLYALLRGSFAIRILVAILVVLTIWKIVEILDMVLLTAILDQFLGVGAIALMIIFAPEIRRFLVIFGKNTFLDRLWRGGAFTVDASREVDEILNGIEQIKNARIGSLLVLTAMDPLERIQETGDKLNSEISGRLIHSIFMPGSPLHDGAVIIAEAKITAARCVLPISDNPDIPPELGLRHRAALGISELSEAMVIIVSEESNQISIAVDGELERNIDLINLERRMREHYQLKVS